MQFQYLALGVGRNSLIGHASTTRAYRVVAAPELWSLPRLPNDIVQGFPLGSS